MTSVSPKARVCKIEDCGHRLYARGWCNRHYLRWRNHGDPEGGGPLRQPAPLDGLCEVERCDKPAQSRGWCGKHYQRWYKYGDPLIVKQRNYKTPEEAFAARTEWQGDCLIWTGGKGKGGYGHIQVNGRLQLTHRYAWERVNGPIPEGMLVDHKDHCDTACCNVKHLRLATNTQNVRNLSGAKANSQTGVRNVFPYKGGYMVQVQGRYFGVFTSIKEADEVAEKARQELFKEFAGRG